MCVGQLSLVAGDGAASQPQTGAGGTERDGGIGGGQKKVYFEIIKEQTNQCNVKLLCMII